MLTISEFNEIRQLNPNLSMLEILELMRERYSMDAQDVGVFVRSNKTLFGEISKECAKLGLIKTEKQVNLEEVF